MGLQWLHQAGTDGDMDAHHFLQEMKIYRQRMEEFDKNGYYVEVIEEIVSEEDESMEEGVEETTVEEIQNDIIEENTKQTP